MKVIDLMLKLFDMPLMAEIELDMKTMPNVNISYSLTSVDVNKYGDVSLHLDSYGLYEKEMEYIKKRETGIEPLPQK